MRTATVYITDKSNEKYFIELIGELFVDSAKRNMEIHLKNARLYPKVYSFLNLETAEIKVEFNN